eukprot:Em0015g703a
MLECTRSDVRDGVGWKCSSCKTRRSVREGSFFAKSQLTLQTWIMLLHFWARQNPVSDTAECAKVALNTAVDVYQWLREVCSTRLINDGPVMLGGNGVVVQIDESLFKHKPKYHRGRRADYEQWVFGMVDTSQTPSLGFMQMVDTRDAATLLPIIRAHTAPGTIIHSDEWAAYRRISQDIPHLQHATVNHSVEFVNPTNGVHTQNIESYWNSVKKKFKLPG